MELRNFALCMLYMQQVNETSGVASAATSRRTSACVWMCRIVCCSNEVHIEEDRTASGFDSPPFNILDLAKVFTDAGGQDKRFANEFVTFSDLPQQHTCAVRFDRASVCLSAFV